jgi:menaquinone-dependent protoporphyrinogen IX oxidase
MTKRNCQAKLIDLKKIDDVKPGDFDAVVVVNSVPDWRKAKSVEKLLAKGGAALRKKLVVVTTAKKDSWRPKLEGIDAMTTASKLAHVDGVVADVWKRLNAILGKTP